MINSTFIDFLRWENIRQKYLQRSGRYSFGRAEMLRQTNDIECGNKTNIA